MVDKKISELTNITGANLADLDEFVVVDVSASETKAVTRAELFLSVPNVTTSGSITGTAVQSNVTDATAGKLLTVGAFGLGAGAPQSPTGDLNDLTTSGLYAFETATLNRPPATNGTVVHITRTSTIHTQLAVSRASDTLGRMYVRANDGTAWSAWREVYHQGSILGAVSQSSGVPTGAVIERGSNANGEYVRFADGTQICTKAITAEAASTAVGSIYRSGTFSWTFPASYSTNPVVTGSCYEFANWIGVGYVSTTTAIGVRFATGNETTTPTVKLTSIGSWF